MSATPEQIAERLEALFGGALSPLHPNDTATCRAAASLIRAQSERERVLEGAGAFLVDRLSDFERDGDVRTDDGQRDWDGHIGPALSRFRKALRGAP